MSVQLNRIARTLRGAWRKNSPELLGLFDGSLPDFVTAARPAERLEGVPVFCFHLVEPERLHDDLAFLHRNGYRTLSAAELLAHLDDHAPVASRSVVLTFDDGPRNFHDVAFPLLKAFNAHAIAFVAPGLHGDEDGETSDRPMTWDELHAVQRSGLVEIQSHTFESRYVPTWPTPAPLAGCHPELEARRRLPAALPIERDLARSREEIERRLPGTAVRHLSFPMYIGSEAAIASARAQGFQACYWGYRPRRPLNRAGDSPFHISRISDEFLRRLPGERRATALDLMRERYRRIQAARRWAADHPASDPATG